MKVPFKSVGISTFVHATESEKKLKEALRTLIPEEVEIEREEVEGHYGDPIIILSVDFQRRPFLREFWKDVWEKLSEKDRRWLVVNAVERIGEDCRLYLRSDKQALITENVLKFSDAGNVVHIRINISAYPAKKEIAVKKIQEFIEQRLKNK